MSDLRDHFDRLEWVRYEIEYVLMPKVDAYEISHPYGVEYIPDPSGTFKVAFAKINKPPPKDFQIRAGVLKNELRAILDSLACVLAERAGAKSIRSVSFPIAESESEYDGKKIQDKIAKLYPADRALIRAMKPWSGGNNMLYALHVNDRTRKHQRLLLTAASASGLKLSGNFTRYDRFVYGGDLVKGAVVARLAMHSDPRLEVGVQLCFSEPASIRGKPLVSIIYEMTNAVETVLKVFK